MSPRRLIVRAALLSTALLPATALAAGAATAAPIARAHAVHEGEAAIERIEHGNFAEVALYRPAGDARQVVLLLSDARGWDDTMDATARALAGDGALAIGIDVPALRREFAREGGDCVFPDGDLENLSHYVQGYLRLPGYRAPLLVGVGEGAALAYAMAAGARAGVFSGAVTVGFRPDLDLGAPACRGTDAAGRLRPVPGLAVPWVALQGARDTRYPLADLRAFATGMRAAAVAPQPRLASEDGTPGHWLPGLRAAVRTLAGRSPQAPPPPPPPALAGLPLVEVPRTAPGRGDLFAVLLSGDGGWAGMDRDVADALAGRGIPVVGFDSLRYFWAPRDPAGLARDLDQVVRTYSARWQRPHVLLVGYSQGADVLPFAVNRLPPATRARVVQTVLIGPGREASFEFHLGSWLAVHDAAALPIRPELLRLAAADTLCVYGDGDGDQTCTTLPAGHLRAVALSGGHHFDGDYGAVATAILAAVPPPREAATSSTSGP